MKPRQRCQSSPCRTCTISDIGSRYLCACSAWPREGCVQHNRTCQAFKREQTARLGRQKPHVWELAVATHGGASPRHTTCVVYGRLCTSWVTDMGHVASIRNWSVALVQNKTKQNKRPPYPPRKAALLAQHSTAVWEATTASRGPWAHAISRTSPRSRTRHVGGFSHAAG